MTVGGHNRKFTLGDVVEVTFSGAPECGLTGIIINAEDMYYILFGDGTIHYYMYDSSLELVT